jgi:hypothetical protein
LRRLENNINSRFTECYNNSIHEILFGSETSSLFYANGNFISKSTTSIFTIQIPLVTRNFEDNLKRIFIQENLTGKNQYEIYKGSFVDAIKKLEFESLAKIIYIQLMRASYRNNVLIKNNVEIIVPECISIPVQNENK